MEKVKEKLCKAYVISELAELMQANCDCADGMECERCDFQQVCRSANEIRNITNSLVAKFSKEA